MNDKEMIDFTFNSQFNIGVQLKQGVTSDYFWYEGSIHYNFFLLEGVCYLFLFSKLFDYDFGSENTEIYENMLKKAYYFAFDNNYFPNPNDGWPNLNLKTYSYIYHTAAKAFGPNSEMANIVKNIENKPGIRTKLPLSEPYYCNNEFCLERLLFNIDYDYNNYTKLTRESYNCPKSNYSMLRDGRMNAFIKYGLNGKSHAHPDIMNVEITYDGKRVSRDLSNAGYISKLCKSWHRKSVSHNTVVFNAKDMTSVAPGQTLEFDDNHISVIGKNIYTGIQDGIDYKRSISIKENEFNDTFEVKSSIEGTFDYVFHFEEAVKFLKPDNMVDVTLGFDTCGYEYIENVQKLNEETDCVVLKAKLNEYEVTIEIDTSDKKELYFCKTMDNPVNFTRSTIIVRSRSNNPVFKMTITFSNDYNFE